MMRRISFVLIAVFALSGTLPTVLANTQEAEINCFFSETCPHCYRESLFLEDLQNEYGDELVINSYSIHEADTKEILENFIEDYGAQDALGLVPLTFVGNEYFVGFDSADGQIGQGIVNEVESLINPTGGNDSKGNNKSLSLPIIGDINLEEYSLPTLAIILGALDGFNVCSLGALVLILGLTLQLKSRKKIFMYGGIFLLTTAVIYGVLISFWYKLFGLIGGSLGALNLIIGLVGIAGGLYFLKEFWRLRKVGMICKTTGASFVDKVTKKAEEAFQKPNQIFILALAIISFAAVVAIVEFPCSAAIPVVFAGILAEQGIGGLGYLSLMGLFLLFYLIDEIIIFAIAAWQMKVVFASPNLTIWGTFIEALLLLGLGSYYILSFL